MIQPWEYAALVIALVMLVVSLAIAVWPYRPDRRASFEPPLTWEEYQLEHHITPVVRSTIVELETGHFEVALETGPIVVIGPMPRKRHNLHCAKCGRFARAVPDMPGVTYCQHHGMTTRLVFIPDTVAELDLVYPSIGSKLDSIRPHSVVNH